MKSFRVVVAQSILWSGLPFLKNCFIYYCLHWILVATCGLSLIAAFGVWSTDSVIVAHRLGCPVACGIFPDRGSNLYPLHRQEDS